MEPHDAVMDQVEHPSWTEQSRGSRDAHLVQCADCR